MRVASPAQRMAFSAPQLLIAALLFLALFLNYVDRQILSVLAPVLRTQIGLTEMRYAMAVNAFLLAYAFMYAGSGLLLDRLGTRRGLALAVAFWSLVSGLHATIRGFAGLVVFRFLLGLTEPGGWTGAVKVVAERFVAAQRGLVTGLFSAGATVGAVIAVPLTVFAAQRYGWRSAFLVPAIIGLLWTPLWLRATRSPDPVQPVASAQNGLNLSQLLSVARDRRVLAYALCRFFGDSSAYFFLFWIPDYLVSSRGFSLSMLGALGWIPFCSADIGALLGGYASGRLVQSGAAPLLARKLTMTVAAALVTLGMLSQIAVSASTIILALSASAFGVGVWAGNLHALTADGFPSRIVATVHGLGGSAGAVGGILFNTLVGHLSAARNHLAVFLVLTLLEPLGVAALWIWLGEGRQDRQEQISEIAQPSNLPAAP